MENHILSVDEMPKHTFAIGDIQPINVKPFGLTEVKKEDVLLNPDQYSQILYIVI